MADDKEKDEENEKDKENEKIKEKKLEALESGNREFKDEVAIQNPEEIQGDWESNRLIDTHSDPIESARFEKSKAAKSLERFLFSAWIWTQHIIMLSVMLSFRFNLGPKGFSTDIFLIAISAMFVIGHGMEWYYQIKLNPFAKNMNRFSMKKYIFYIVAFCLLIVMMVLVIVYCMKTLSSQIILGLFMVIVLLIGAIFYLNEIKMIYHKLIIKMNTMYNNNTIQMQYTIYNINTMC